jgi:DNA polymerase-3 subunit delta
MIIFLYGEDSFRSRKKLNELKEKFVREVDPSGANLSVIDGEKTTLREINENVSPVSLLSRKRMVVIENILQNKATTIFEELEKFLENKKDQDLIIIFFDSNIKTGKKGGKEVIMTISSSGEEKPLTVKPLKLFKFLAKEKFAQEFKKLSILELEAWAKKEVETRGGAISREAAHFLATSVAGDLWKVNNEIDKLLAYKRGAEPQLINQVSVEINLQDVKMLVRDEFQDDIFALVDALSAKNKSTALKLIENFIDAGENENYLLSMIIRQVRILIQAKEVLAEGYGPKKFASDFKIHPFVAQKSITQARNFNDNQLMSLFKELIAADYKMKTGQGDIKTILSLEIAKL